MNFMPRPALTTPGERLRYARETAGFESRPAVERRFPDIKAQTLKKDETDERKLSGDDAERYGRAFKCSPWWLLFRAGPGPGEPPVTALDTGKLAAIVAEVVETARGTAAGLSPEIIADIALAAYQKLGKGAETAEVRREVAAMVALVLKTQGKPAGK